MDNRPEEQERSPAKTPSAIPPRLLPSPGILLLAALLLFMAGTMTASLVGWASSPTQDLCASSSQDAGFVGLDMHGADLAQAQLAGAELCGANLRGAILREACLRGARLDGADLTGAVVTGADFTEATVRGAVGVPQELPTAPSACTG